MSSIKISKLLATAGIASRRKAEELVLAGKVTLNGKIMRNVAERVLPEKDVVSVGGRIISAQEDPVVLVLNKPAGVVSTVSDPDGKPTVMNYIPEEFEKYRLFPVGRLDEESEGLMLLTNDGNLAYTLTHPKFAVSKVYHVVIQGHLSESEISRIRRGVPLKGKKTRPAEVTILDRTNETQILEITIREGMNRQIRRMMKALNHPVLRLQRQKMGEYSLGKLDPGMVRKEPVRVGHN